jgi:glycosyltransferase involved in cell wall biosynthesis
MTTPAVTILMPAYNVSSYIGEAVSSVLAQDFTDYELLIIDDGSTDDTPEIVQLFHDPRIRLLRQTHTGIAAALNLGLKEAGAGLVARFDADDICLPGRFACQVRFLSEHPDYVICGGNAEYINAEGEHLFHYKCHAFSHEEIVDHIYDQCPFIHSAVMYRRNAILEVGGYPGDANNFEDHLLWVRLVDKGKYANLQQELIRVRFNPSSVTMDEKWRGDKFGSLKKQVLRQGFVKPEQHSELQSILQSQDLRKIKEGAYYALCGKKFLLDNHQPAKARHNLSRAIRSYPLRWDNYALYLLSFFPSSWIGWLHRSQSIQTKQR